MVGHDDDGVGTDEDVEQLMAEIAPDDRI